MNEDTVTPYTPEELWNTPSAPLPPSGPLLRRILYSLFADRPFDALEIGVHTATKVKMAMRLPLQCRRWVGVDPYLGSESDPYRGSYWNDTEGADSVYRKALEVYESYHQPLLRITSQEYFEQANDRFDLIFVDGDHRFEPALNDLRGAMRLIKPDGIILIDDYGNSDTPQVTRAINTFIDSQKHRIRQFGYQYFQFQNRGKHMPIFKSFVYLQVKEPGGHTEGEA